jgi:hypothetical protein
MCDENFLVQTNYSVGIKSPDRDPNLPLDSKLDESCSNVIFPVAELAYLKGNDDVDGDNKNDPLSIVQKLFNSSEGFAAALPPSESSAMHSVCLALGVKSGRLSLLLRAAAMITSANTSHMRSSLKDIEILNDIAEYLSIETANKEDMIQAAFKRSFQESPAYSSTSPTPSSSSSYSSSPFSTNNQSERVLNSSEYSLGIQSNDVLHHIAYNSVNTPCNRVTLSFGKADHGKLGLGDSQVNSTHCCQFLYMQLLLSLQLQHFFT